MNENLSGFPLFAFPIICEKHYASWKSFQIQRFVFGLFAAIAVPVALTGCASVGSKSYELNLMPAPDVYDDVWIDPFIDGDVDSQDRRFGVLYATDRLPAEEGDERYPNYTNDRGHVVRLGEANFEFAFDEPIDWEVARQMSLLKNRTEDYPLKVASVEEFGPFLPSVRPFDEYVERTVAPADRFVDEINERLEVTRTRDVYIYVHGYRVDFENPALVASELWHFLGYNGAFVTYSWPTSTSRIAYIADIESAVTSARGLRMLITHISEFSHAERIHVIGFSAGTRLVSRALADLGMFAYGLHEDEIRSKVKLGHVILIGSDVDRPLLGGFLLDGVLNILDDLAIYASGTDEALGMSSLLLRRYRTGQVEDIDSIGPRSREFFENTTKLRLIDVTGAEGSDTGNGHAYFRTSPWVSSDILMTLMHDLPPEQRGLVMRADLPIWTFPDDYTTRIKQSLESVGVPGG